MNPMAFLACALRKFCDLYLGNTSHREMTCLLIQRASLVSSTMTLHTHLADMPSGQDSCLEFHSPPYMYTRVHSTEQAHRMSYHLEFDGTSPFRPVHARHPGATPYLLMERAGSYAHSDLQLLAWLAATFLECTR